MNSSIKNKNIKSDWNSMAEAYEVFNNSPDSYSFNIEWPCIRAILPELKGKTILDLGCGTGIFTFLLEAYKPERITGIDLSEEMLRIARKKADDANSIAIFIMGDASNCADYLDEPVDFIFSSTMSHYLDDLSELFANVSRCLKDDGLCIFSIIHPLYSSMYPIARGDAFPEDEAWGVRYLDRSLRAYVQPWLEYNDDYENHLSKSYHHTFADYVNAITKSGLVIEQVYEPLPPELWKSTQQSRYDGYLETPVYMIIKMKRKAI